MMRLIVPFQCAHRFPCIEDAVALRYDYSNSQTCVYVSKYLHHRAPVWRLPCFVADHIHAAHQIIASFPERTGLRLPESTTQPSCTSETRQGRTVLPERFSASSSSSSVAPPALVM